MNYEYLYLYSYPVKSVDWCQAGVMSTATHGSGLGYGCLATLVSEFSLLLANGEILKASPYVRF
jgi:hypothetical protein